MISCEFFGDLSGIDGDFEAAQKQLSAQKLRN